MSKESESEPNNILQDLTAGPQSRKCKYPSCNNEILIESQFPYCERCRSLAAGNAVRLLIDPCTPQALQRSDAVAHALLTSLTAAEILRTAQRIEDLYLTFKKHIALYKIEPSIRKVFKTLEEQVEEAREYQQSHSIQAKQSRRREKKNKTRAEKLEKLLGVTQAKAKELLQEHFDL